MLLLVGAGAGFYFGWIQHKIPVGKFGVFYSQIGGIEKKVIQNGEFAWRWQCLIPNSSELFIFENKPHHIEGIFTEELPMSDTYKKLLSEGDFSYSIKYSVTVCANLDYIGDLIEQKTVQNQAQLNSFLATQSERIKDAAISYLVTKFQSTDEIRMEDFSLDLDEAKSGLKFAEIYPQVEVTDFSVSLQKAPNISLYNVAQNAYNAYLEEMSAKIAADLDVSGSLASSDFYNMERYLRWANAIKENPELLEIIKLKDFLP